MAHFSEYTPVIRKHTTIYSYLVIRKITMLFKMNSLDQNILGRFLWQQMELRRTRNEETQFLRSWDPCSLNNFMPKLSRWVKE